MAFHQYATWCTAGFTYDSYQYLAAAQTFGENYTLLNAAGEPYTAFAPLFPVILSFFGDAVFQAVPIFNGVLLAASLSIFRLLGNKVITGRKVNALCFASLALGTPLLLIHRFFWSEPVFLLLIAVKLLLLFRALDSGKFRFILLLGIAGFLLCLQRNAGIFFVAGITISLVFLGKDPHKKLYSLYYLLVSVSGFSLWNYYAAQTAGRDLSRHPFLTGFFDNSMHYIHTMGSWFLPLPVPAVVRGVLFIALACTSGLVIWKSCRNIPAVTGRHTKALFIVLTMYLAGLFVFTGDLPFESERLLAVAYPLAMLLFFFPLDQAGQLPSVRKYYRLILVAVALWLLYPAVRTIKNAHQWHKVGCQPVPKSSSSASSVGKGCHGRFAAVAACNSGKNQATSYFFINTKKVNLHGVKNEQKT